MMKAGLIEIADLYAINKSDRKDSDKLYLNLKNMLELSDNDWMPEIIKTIAINGEGISELYNKINNHRNYLLDSQNIYKKYNKRFIKRIKDKLVQDFENSFWNENRIKILNIETTKEINKRSSIQTIINKIKSSS